MSDVFPVIAPLLLSATKGECLNIQLVTLGKDMSLNSRHFTSFLSDGWC